MSVTPRTMIAAIEWLEACEAVPGDVLARVQSVPLSDMDAGQAETLVAVAVLYGMPADASC